MSTELTLEQSLQAYRVLNTPSNLSWKQHWVQETFSHDNLLDCTEQEKIQFAKRLQECEITICSGIKQTQGQVKTLNDLIQILCDPKNKSIPKISRSVIYSTANGERPIGKRAFEIWNGFQVIDMDIKDEKVATSLKSVIFNSLYKCNWFLGVALSSSGKGLHVYTKISIPEDETDASKRKLLYLTNFRHKYSFVYLACIKNAEKSGYTKDDVLKWMDFAMFKPQQGAFIGYDPHPMINTRFFEDFIYVDFDNVQDIGSPEIDWVTYPDLRAIFKRWDWFESQDDEESLKIEVVDAKPLEVDVRNKVHYKHYERWRLANTLVKIYGLDQGYTYLRMICANSIRDKELMADCITAKRHEKPVDEWAVNRLNTQHGFKIKLNIQDTSFDESQILESMNHIDNPVLIKQSKYTKTYHINKNQYLGHIRHQLFQDLGRITLIEAGAGVGKTEMIKQVVRDDHKKVCLVMPFTSTIKSKVEQDKDWYYSYGSRKPRLDISGGLALTLDKFARLTLQDLKVNGFDYIIIDESHLLFQSEYRPVMPKVIEMIRNTEVQIILMSGTPSGELVFFPDIVHLHVIKEETRRLDMKVNLVSTPSDLLWHMCKKMAADIANGKRILFPTNRGTLYSKQIKAAVTYFMQNDWANFDEVRLEYYKKSNVGEKFMDDVNFKKTIKNVQILMCTTYLSVGVDIWDREKFEIYFDDLFTPQEVNQFCNRLRANDLYINLYVSKNDAEGNSRSLHRYKPLNFKLNDEEIKNVHSILRICNAMIERNPVEYKYNSLVSSIIRNNTYIEYNEIDNKYYLNEIAYKVVQFERKYRDYVQQLPVLMRGMMAYGFTVSAKDLQEFQVEGNEVFADMKNMVKLAYNEQLHLNTSHIEELLDIITEDRLNIYRSVLRGNFEIRKGSEWKEDLSKQIMTVKNIEVFEKVVPIVISLSKRYSIEDIRDIFEHCKKKGSGYNFAAIDRIRILVNLVYNDQNQRLDLPIKEYMQRCYEFTQIADRHKNEIRKFNQECALDYAMRESTETIVITRAQMTIQQMFKTFEKMFKCLVDVGRPDKKGMCHLERIELLWQPKEAKLQNAIKQQAFMLEEFLEGGNIEIENVQASKE